MKILAKSNPEGQNGNQAVATPHPPVSASTVIHADNARSLTLADQSILGICRAVRHDHLTAAIRYLNSVASWRE